MLWSCWHERRGDGGPSPGKGSGCGRDAPEPGCGRWSRPSGTRESAAVDTCLELGGPRSQTRKHRCRGRRARLSSWGAGRPGSRTALGLGLRPLLSGQHPPAAVSLQPPGGEARWLPLPEPSATAPEGPAPARLPRRSRFSATTRPHASVSTPLVPYQDFRGPCFFACHQGGCPSDPTSPAGLHAAWSGLTGPGGRV